MAHRRVDDGVRVVRQVQHPAEVPDRPQVLPAAPGVQGRLDGGVVVAPPQVGRAARLGHRGRQQPLVRDRCDEWRRPAGVRAVRPSPDLDQQRVLLDALLDGAVDDAERPAPQVQRGAAVEEHVDAPGPVAVHDAGERGAQRRVVNGHLAVEAVLHRVAADDRIPHAAVARLEPHERLDGVPGQVARGGPDRGLRHRRVPGGVLGQEPLGAGGEHVSPTPGRARRGAPGPSARRAAPPASRRARRRT